MANLENKKKILQQIRCFLAHNILLIGVKMTIWREEAVTVKEGGGGRVSYVDII